MKISKIIIAASLFFLLLNQAVAEYAIIVDAGSSGSRLHLFQYEAQTSGVAVINDIFSESVKPGLSAFANAPSNAGPSLKKLFDDVSEQLKKNNVAPQSVSVSILATAGMRLLPAATQNAIYNNVHYFLESNYAFPIADVKTISGTMEGVYGWLDVNYLQQTFQHNQPTVGAIDLGGASTQISFALNAAVNNRDSINIHLGGKRYTVFSKSFLGAGQDQAREQIRKMPQAHVCFPVGYQENELNGQFNLAGCGEAYRQFILDMKIGEQLVLPEKNQRFVAFSGYFYAYDFFNAVNNPERSNLVNNIESVCTQSWEQLQQRFPNVPTAFLATYCANGVYIDDLVYGTYQLQGNQLIVANKIGGKEIDWTLGALLYRLSNPSSLKLN